MMAKLLKKQDNRFDRQSISPGHRRPVPPRPNPKETAPRRNRPTPLSGTPPLRATRTPREKPATPEQMPPRQGQHQQARLAMPSPDGSVPEIHEPMPPRQQRRQQSQNGRDRQDTGQDAFRLAQTLPPLLPAEVKVHMPEDPGQKRRSAHDMPPYRPISLSGVRLEVETRHQHQRPQHDQQNIAPHQFFFLRHPIFVFRGQIYGIPRAQTLQTPETNLIFVWRPSHRPIRRFVLPLRRGSGERREEAGRQTNGTHKRKKIERPLKKTTLWQN